MHLLAMRFQTTSQIQPLPHSTFVPFAVGGLSHTDQAAARVQVPGGALQVEGEAVRATTSRDRGESHQSLGNSANNSILCSDAHADNASKEQCCDHIVCSLTVYRQLRPEITYRIID